MEKIIALKMCLTSVLLHFVTHEEAIEAAPIAGITYVQCLRQGVPRELVKILIELSNVC